MKKSTKIILIVVGVLVVVASFAAYYYWGIYLPANPSKKKPTGLPATKLTDLLITPTPPSPSTIKTAAPAAAAA